MKSATHSWFGQSAWNCRFTRSSGHGALASGTVVRTDLPRRTPRPALAAAQPQEAMGQDAALEVGIVLASVWPMKLAACCCTKRYSAVCSGRWRS